jgi:hypothetical protein
MVGGGVLLVIVVILLIVFAPKGGKTPAAQPSDSAPSAAATEAAAAPTCDPADLSITASVDKSHFAVGEVPQLSFSLTNNGAKECQFAAGSDVQEYVISSGKETYWNSKDCQTAPAAAVVPIKAGESVGPSAPLPWDRTRSDASACDSPREQVPAGGPTYALTVTVNGVESKPVKFILD